MSRSPVPLCRPVVAGGDGHGNHRRRRSRCRSRNACPCCTRPWATAQVKGKAVDVCHDGRGWSLPRLAPAHGTGIKVEEGDRLRRPAGKSPRRKASFELGRTRGGRRPGAA